jgi:hypothetical protein
VVRRTGPKSGSPNTFRKFSRVRLNLKREIPRRSPRDTGLRLSHRFQITGKTTKASTTVNVGNSIQKAILAS